jgi:hypothetical protein
MYSFISKNEEFLIVLGERTVSSTHNKKEFGRLSPKEKEG